MIPARELFVNISYLLAHPESLPRASEDLYEMFNLASLAAEVAREKPNGEKNALRKTYKGHIKRLGVAGHFDVQKKKEDAPSEFMAMLQVPDLEWNVHQVKGREITDGLSDISLASLGRAVTMAKGPIPKGVWDSSVLGDIAPSNGDSKQPSSARPTAPNTPLAGAPGAVNRLKSQGPPGSDPLRPRRNIKKRTYGDSSYEGYGEGFPDDDAGVEAGYSTGEGEGGQKRRKKVNTRPCSLSKFSPLISLALEPRKCVTLPERYAPTKLRSWHGWRLKFFHRGYSIRSSLSRQLIPSHASKPLPAN